MNGSPGGTTPGGAAVARWEIAACGLAMAISFSLGAANLNGPSLWHDELIHVFVAKNILATGTSLLPSGNPYPSGAVYNYILAVAISLFGDGETAVRLPSVILGMINVLLTYLLARRLFDSPTAAVAALLLAVSPWSVAWSRQARFYALQQTLYLVWMALMWRTIESGHTRRAAASAIAAAAAYLASIFTSLHSVLFAGPIGVFASGAVVSEWLKARRVNWRMVTVCCVTGLAAAASLGGYYLWLPEADHAAIFVEGGLDGRGPDPIRDRGHADRYYYPRFFHNNLSAGYFVLALAGLFSMPFVERRRGWFVALAFLAPICVLSYLGYRRHRFLYFAYPFYVMASAYALVRLSLFLATARKAWWRMATAAVIALFAARLAVSTVRLVSDSVRVAGGADLTLAKKHPQWRDPCRYVKEHRGDAAVIATTYLPVLYYAGHIDTWYPSRIIVWEFAESGVEGLNDVSELQEFIRAHPRGYFLADYRRFAYWRFYAEDVAWVEQNMVRVDEACSEDITVYAWGMQDSPPGAAEPNHDRAGHSPE